jgi:hypothetical protein
MRPARLRRRPFALLTGFLAVALCVCAVALGVIAQAGATETTVGQAAAPAGTAAPATTTSTAAPTTTPTAVPLTIAVDRMLSLVSEPVTVDVKGDLGTSLVGAKLVVRIKGPAGVSQVGASEPALNEVDKVVVVLGGAPSTTTSTTTGDTGAAQPVVTSSTTTTTPVAVTGNDGVRLSAGTLVMSVQLAAHRPDVPGAYQLVVEVKSGSTVLASGQTWIGKAAERAKPLDLAFVWPVSLGVHRDADGVFYDSVIEDALGTTEGATAPGGGSLRGIAGAAQLFPAWNFTLAIEPVLLTQLRDMADGYTRRDALGNETEVASSDPRAQNADALLAAFKTATDAGSVEAAVSPYAGADLTLLAAEGWRDGFEQIQMGKQELQETLGLSAPLTGAYSPGLSLSSASLGSYADASIDHVVVSSDLAGMLTEPIEPGVVTVRTRDEENHRATLVLADAALGAQIASPWDPSLLFATLAAELAATPRDAAVITPGLQFGLVPDAYVEAVGKALGSLDWVRTRTVGGLLRDYSPGTRPVMLKTTTGTAAGYIESTLLGDLRSAHEVVTDLADIADATRAPVEAVHRLLYVAESRWWWRPGTSPQEASVGLAYARKARELAQAELDKIAFAGADSGLIAGNAGVVRISLENKAEYAVTARLQLGGTGLTLPDGPSVDLELQPGKTTVRVRVAVAGGSHVLDVKLVAGQTTLDELSHTVRFITVKTVLPGIIVGGLLVLAGIYFLIRRLVKKGNLRWPKKLRLRRVR